MATNRQGLPRSRLEHFADTLARLGAALDVALSADLLRDGDTLRMLACRAGRDATDLGLLDWLLARLSELLDRLGVVPEIHLAGDEDDGETVAEVEDL